MCLTCPDEELEEWQYHCASFYSNTALEVLEERFMYQGHHEKLLLRHRINNFYTFCHLSLREDITNPLAFPAFSPKAAAEDKKFLIKAIEQLCGIDGEIAPAWYGTLGQFSVQAAWSLCAIGEIEEGYKYLDEAFCWYEKWVSIPDGTLLEVGDEYAFGGIKIKKDANCWNLILPDGSTEWYPYALLFMADKSDLYTAMTAENGGGWYTGCEGFDSVREDERFKELVNELRGRQKREKGAGLRYCQLQNRKNCTDCGEIWVRLSRYNKGFEGTFVVPVGVKLG